MSSTLPMTEPLTTEATSSNGSAPSDIAQIAIRQSGGIPDVNIDGIRVTTAWSDIVNEVVVPTIEVSTGVSNLDYEISMGPSDEGTFTVKGNDLTDDLTVTAPTDFEISKTSGGTFEASLDYMRDGMDNVALTTVYVRLKSGLSIADYSGDVNVTSSGATTQTVSLNGSVFNTLTNALVITGVFDNATGSTPKGIEIQALADIADLSIFGMGSANNGNGGGAQEFTFPSVSATNGEKIYIVSTGQIADFNTFFGESITDYASGAASINGDDAIELFENGQIIDTFGDVNTDGTGEPWDYLDGWAYRVNGTGPDGNTFVLGNWTFSGTGNLNGATNAASTSPFPIKTYTLDSGSFEIEGFSMYPNPTDIGYVNISSRNNSKMQVSIYDMLGKQVINETVANKTLDVSELNAGIYIMKFNQEEASTTKKLVIR